MKKNQVMEYYLSLASPFLIFNSFFVIVPADLSTIMGVVVGTFIESLIIYLIIILITYIVNRYSKLS